MRKKVPAFKRQKKSRLPVFVVLAVVAAFCGYIFVRSVALQNAKSNLQTDIDTLNTQIEDENKRTEELKEKETYMHTKKYAEEVAKDVLNYVYENEVIFKPSKN